MSGFGLGTLASIFDIGGAVASAFRGSSFPSQYKRDRVYEENARNTRRAQYEARRSAYLMADYLPANQRRGMERAGLNPLLAAGAPVAPPVAGHNFTPFMSGSNLNGLSAASDTLLGLEALKQQKAELELEKQRLEKQTEDLKIKEPDGGIYQRGGISVGQNSGENVSGGDDSASSDDGAHGTLDLDNPDNRPPAALRAFGINWKGSGLFEKGETYEEQLGEPGGWLMAPPVIADAFLNTVSRPLRSAEESRQNRQLEDLRNPPKPKKPTKDKRPKARKKEVPPWGTPEYTEYMRKLYQ
ncbi:hypothetical protein RUESEDTHA_03604 [Ruegeria sp. THAF57]|uniref:hypothetical protein n=1 Tax=Ruegeria sp. THAF57 TaxID=2744555 RepID=UPI0015DE9E98|nr:hypothetical protein [Ruegeria sp. THAF57]CAD0186694.1 hypothetical protein RUESEDTHA_03604 [Ruegeria sp. THAF57]